MVKNRFAGQVVSLAAIPIVLGKVVATKERAAKKVHVN